MTINTFKNALTSASSLTFSLPNGEIIPLHFHITEVGLSSKHFIDCGGKIHVEKAANFQIWVATDTDHRLSPKSLLGIIEKSAPLLGDEDLPIEIEYQGDMTIGKFGLTEAGDAFMLVSKQTDCLAQEACGVPELKTVNGFFEIISSGASCTPGGGCC